MCCSWGHRVSLCVEVEPQFKSDHYSHYLPDIRMGPSRDLPLEPTLKRTVITDSHYASLRGRPRQKPVRVIPRLEPPMLEVQRRPLTEYEALTEVTR
jgi:hypothetical protein